MPPGPGIVIRNMLGLTLEEKIFGSGVWLFRGALQGENLFSSLDAAGGWVKKRSDRTAWSVPCDSSCSCSYACMDMAPLLGHILESGAGHC